MSLTRLLDRPPACWSGGDLGLQVEIRPGVPAVAEISGEIDLASASWLRETLLLAIRRHGPAINVDLHGVTFLDCSGINALLATARRARLEGGRMRVISPSRRPGGSSGCSACGTCWRATRAASRPGLRPSVRSCP